MPQEEYSSKQDQFLERRAGSGKRGGSNVSGKRHPVLVSPAAFKQQLIKYCQRQTKHDRVFCLAALRILEYDKAVQEYGKVVAEQLTRLVHDVLEKSLRDADRVCTPVLGRYLLLLPDTDEAGANSALNRVAQTVGAARMHYKHRQLHASCAFIIAGSQKFGSDAEALLDAVGYNLDED